MVRAGAMAQSGDITEALRLDNYFGPAVNAADGSVWASYVAAGDCIASSECGLAHLAVDGTEVCSRTGFGNILGLSVNAADGSCWVADGGVCNTQPSHGSVVHVGPEGTVLWRSAGYNCPQAISVNPVDGSCWVADRYGAEAAYPPSSRIVHLAANGDELSSTEGFGDAWSVSVNPTDGSCWVSDTGHGQLVLLSSTGVEIWRKDYPGFHLVAADPANNTCWAADNGQVPSPWNNTPISGGQVVRLAEDGTELWRGNTFTMVKWLSANPSDGSCWVASRCPGQVLHLAQDGSVLWQEATDSCGLSVNPSDGSCWVADADVNQLVHLLPHGLAVTASASPDTVAGGGTTQLTASAVDNCGHGIATWAWSDGGAGGSFSDASVYNPIYTAPMNNSGAPITVTLSVTATCDGSSPVSGTASATLSVTSAAPVADFSGTPTSGPAPLQVTFQDQSTNTPTAWSWDFGDGGSDTVQNPQHTYQTAGSYTVTLTASNAGGSNTASKPAYVTVGVLHTLSVTARADQFIVSSGATVNLTATVTDSLGHNVASCSWADGGNGGSFGNANALTTTYTAPSNTTNGTLSIPLTATVTCDGTTPLTASGATLLMVRGLEMYQPGEEVELSTAQEFPAAIDPVDGSWWVINTYTGHCPHDWVSTVEHLAADGTLLGASGDISGSVTLSLNPADGSCWIAASKCDINPSEGVVVHLASDCTDLFRTSKYDCPMNVSVNPADGSCWISEFTNSGYDGSRVIHLGSDGHELSAKDGFRHVMSVSVNPSTGDCWAADWGDWDGTTNSNGSLTLFAADGSVRWSKPFSPSWEWVSVDLMDNSCWVIDKGFMDGANWHIHVARLAEDGTELCRTDVMGDMVGIASGLASNPADGSLWVATHCSGGQIVHLAQDGSVLWSQDLGSCAITLDPSDGSCWVSGYNGVIHLGLHTLQVTASADPATVASGETTTLSASAVDNLGQPVRHWSWSDGGAGGTFSDPASQYTSYTAPANTSGADLTITLTVTATVAGAYPMSSSGNDDADRARGPGPAADFSATPLSGTAPLAVAFTDASTGAPTAWSWNFGDGSLGSGPTPTHTYYQAGSYAVCAYRDERGWRRTR